MQQSDTGISRGSRESGQPAAGRTQGQGASSPPGVDVGAKGAMIPDRLVAPYEHAGSQRDDRGREGASKQGRLDDDSARVKAAHQLAAQAEQEAQRFLKKAASLSADLRLSRAKQRTAWQVRTGASDDAPR